MPLIPNQIESLRAWIFREPLFSLLQRLADERRCTLYLTGGLVRDWLQGLKTRDVDLAVSQKALPLAGDFAARTGGTLVLLKKEEETARVVLPELHFDFAGFRAPSLEEDLRCRDFTINSVALSLSRAFESGPWEPRDPLSGLADLSRGLIRHCAPSAFDHDPLRILRAFRLAAQYNLSIAPETRQAIREAGPRLQQAAAERRRYEWNLLLAQGAAFPALELMDEDGVLEILLPELIPLRDTPQNGFHHLNVRDHTLLAFRHMEVILDGAFPLPPAPAEDRGRYLASGKMPPCLKWAVLCHDLGKPAAAGEKEARLTFLRHERIGRELFESIAVRFRLSRWEKETIQFLIGSHMHPFHLLNLEARGTLTRRAKLRFVRAMGDDLAGVLLMALADSRAACGPLKPSDLETRLVGLWGESIRIREDILRPLDEVSPLVTGDDLIALGFRPGPIFREILNQVREEQWLGSFRERGEALDWIRKNWANKKPS